MSSIYLLLPVALILGLIGLILMIWAVRNGQFEDLDGPAHRILFEDDQDLVPHPHEDKAVQKKSSVPTLSPGPPISPQSP